MNICKVDYCKTSSRCLGMCQKHYTRYKRHSNTSNILGKPNKITIDGNIAKIHLYGGKDCLIDIDDIPIIKNKVWSWSPSNGVINQFQVSNKHYHIKIHRLIKFCPEGLVVDHKNGSKLDNRKSNLRILKHWENIINQKSRPLRNIERSGKSGYCIRITRNKSRYYLGRFNSLGEAIKARDKFAKKIHGNIRLR